MLLDAVLKGLGITIAVILANALFVAIDYAVRNIRQSRVQEMVDDGHAGAKTIQYLQQNMVSTLAGTQLGVTFASLVLGWVGQNAIQGTGSYLSKYIPGLQGLNLSVELSVGLSFVVLSMLHVIIGEQVPKLIALRLSEKTALCLSGPLRIFCTLCYPLLWIMNGLAGIVLKVLQWFGLPAGDQEHPAHSSDEIDNIVKHSHEAGVLEEQEARMVMSALDLRERTAEEVMVSRGDMVCIADDKSLDEVLKIIVDKKHSKYPVYSDGSRDNIVGILHTIDVISWQDANCTGNGDVQQFRLKDLIRKPPHIVPETMSANELLKYMLSSKIKMVIVKCERGVTTGLVTLEKLLEQIVGEIYDEHDEVQTKIQPLGTGRWSVRGDLPIFEFNREFGSRITCKSCTTIAGAVIEGLRQQPEKGDQVEIGDLRFTVTEINRHAVTKLEVVRMTPPAPPV